MRHCARIAVFVPSNTPIEAWSQECKGRTAWGGYWGGFPRTRHGSKEAAIVNEQVGLEERREREVSGGGGGGEGEKGGTEPSLRPQDSQARYVDVIHVISQPSPRRSWSGVKNVIEKCTSLPKQPPSAPQPGSTTDEASTTRRSPANDSTAQRHRSDEQQPRKAHLRAEGRRKGEAGQAKPRGRES